MRWVYIALELAQYAALYVATKVYSDLERYAHRLTESDIDKYVGTPTATI